MLEPSYDVGGDAFDYALSERTVSLGIFDAMGHGISAALHGRRRAGRLPERAPGRAGRRTTSRGAIDEVISGQFPGSAFVTGVLAELDLAIGPAALRQRRSPPAAAAARGKGGQGAHRRAAGCPSAWSRRADRRRGELEPGDWLALYSDGITEARNAVRGAGSARNCSSTS